MAKSNTIIKLNKTGKHGETKKDTHPDNFLPKSDGTLGKIPFPKKKCFQCSVCDKVCQSKADLKIHMKCHCGEKNYHCTICMKSYSQRSNLNTHINLKHTNNTRFECNICQKRFSRKCDFIKHKEIHKEKCLFACRKCNTSFRTKEYLQRHLNTHDKKKYNCAFCETILSSRSGLALHMKETHLASSKEQERKFKCGTCEKCFTTEHYLKVHRRVHTKEKP